MLNHSTELQTCSVVRASHFKSFFNLELQYSQSENAVYCTFLSLTAAAKSKLTSRTWLRERLKAIIEDATDIFYFSLPEGHQSSVVTNRQTDFQTDTAYIHNKSNDHLHSPKGRYAVYVVLLHRTGKEDLNVLLQWRGRRTIVWSFSYIRCISDTDMQKVSYYLPRQCIQCRPK